MPASLEEKERKEVLPKALSASGRRREEKGARNLCPRAEKRRLFPLDSGNYISFWLRGEGGGEASVARKG